MNAKAKETIIKKFGSWEAYVEAAKAARKKRNDKAAQAGGFAVIDKAKHIEASRAGGLKSKRGRKIGSDASG